MGNVSLAEKYLNLSWPKYESRYVRRKKIITGNTIVNRFPTFREIVFYKNDFKYFKGVSDIKIDRTRKYYYDADGCLRARTGNINFRKLCNSLEKSMKRSKDNFYGYALSNKWDYFITLTVDPKRFSKDDEDRKDYLHIFKNLIKYYDADSMYLITWEEHHNEAYGGENNGTLHFHGVVSMFDIGNHVVEAVNSKTGNPIKTRTGRQVYNFKNNLWKYGFSTLVPIEPDKDSQERVVSYICKYITKGQDSKYNAHRFYHSKNLAKKEKWTLYVDHSDIIDLMNNMFCNVIKDNAKMIVMRVYNEFLKEVKACSALNAKRSSKFFRRLIHKPKSRFNDIPVDMLGRYNQKAPGRILTISKRELEYLNTIF